LKVGFSISEIIPRITAPTIIAKYNILNTLPIFTSYLNFFIKEYTIIREAFKSEQKTILYPMEFPILSEEFYLVCCPKISKSIPPSEVDLIIMVSPKPISKLNNYPA